MPRRSDMPDDPRQRDRRGTGGGSPRTRRGWRRGRTEYARAGFTLVELLAVILIIGILVAIVINVSNRAMRKAAEQRTKTTMRVIMSALEIYREEFGVYPSFKVGNDYRAGNAKLYSLFWGGGSWGSEERHKLAKKRARERLRTLPSDAVSDQGGNRYFVDGFQNVLWYHAKGGAGPGGAYLESPGADNSFEEEEDNLRSDL